MRCMLKDPGRGGAEQGLRTTEKHCQVKMDQWARGWRELDLGVWGGSLYHVTTWGGPLALVHLKNDNHRHTHKARAISPPRAETPEAQTDRHPKPECRSSGRLSNIRSLQKQTCEFKEAQDRLRAICINAG